MTGFTKRIATTFMTAALLLLTLPLSASAASTEYQVSSEAELRSAISEINSAESGEFTISLTGDISTSSGAAFSGENKTINIIGNGHTYSSSAGKNFQISNGTTLNLGDGTTELTLKGGVSGDDPGIIYIEGAKAVCNMRDKVTLKDNK